MSPTPKGIKNVLNVYTCISYVSCLKAAKDDLKKMICCG